MRVEEFEKIVEMWSNHILVDALHGYRLEIDEDVPREFAAIALYLDSATVRAAGEVLEYYNGYRQAASDILNLIGVEMVQDDEMRMIQIKRKAIQEDKQETLKKYIWG
ncbi:MAG TPA: hypothetical protein VNK81_05440 [Thermodesulfobacteriota bacterium]|jgi:hypothetical protein|nr:hypothetical protein [Thermodesulfobacteriota bacterium]